MTQAKLAAACQTSICHGLDWDKNVMNIPKKRRIFSICKSPRGPHYHVNELHNFLNVVDELSLAADSRDMMDVIMSRAANVLSISVTRAPRPETTGRKIKANTGNNGYFRINEWSSYENGH